MSRAEGGRRGSGAGAFQAVARKRFGQHFLADRAVVDAIVRAIDPRPDDRLVEIGPGTGALTGPLLARAGRLVAIELDRDLAPKLSARYGDALQVVTGDALTVDFGTLVGPGERIRVVGNLPYNISSPLLFRLTAFIGSIRDQHFMLQKEVVDRMAAAPGGDMGRLTTVLQNLYRIDCLLDVPPGAFDPPPKVESSVVRMVPRPAPLTAQIDLLQALLASGFSQRRKMLRNTLGKWFARHRPDFDPVMAAERDPRLVPFAEPTRRAEEIPVAAWCALADELARVGRPS